MIRKLISLGMCSLGVLTMVGASAVQALETNFATSPFITATIGTDFAQVVGDNQASSTQTNDDVFLFGDTNEDTKEETKEAQVTITTEKGKQETTTQIATAPDSTLADALENLNSEIREGIDDPMLFVDGVPVPLTINRTVNNGVTYVCLDRMAELLDTEADARWTTATNTMKITSDKMVLTAVMGQYYLEANGRYLYLPEQVYSVDDVMMVPLSVVTRAYDAELLWDKETGVIHVTRGSGAIESGESFYDEDYLFWMSRVVFAESGNQPVEGQMGVAMVVENRINNSAYPDTIVGVLSQKNQFSTWLSGGLANRTPNASSIIAAKLVMDGGVVAELSNATHFDSISGSWASRNLKTITVIGGHTFYA